MKTIQEIIADLTREANRKPSYSTPEPNNGTRAGWAELAVDAHSAVTGVNDEDFVSIQMHDLLCNLMHLADQKDVDFSEVVERAASIYRDEKWEEGRP